MTTTGLRIYLSASLVLILPLIATVALSNDSPSIKREKIEFTIARCLDSKRVANVNVIISSRMIGLTTIAKTNRYGVVFIDKESLAEADAILFCKDGYFCGALRIKEDHVLELDERLIHLASFAMN